MFDSSVASSCKNVEKLKKFNRIFDKTRKRDFKTLLIYLNSAKTISLNMNLPNVSLMTLLHPVDFIRKGLQSRSAKSLRNAKRP